MNSTVDFSTWPNKAATVTISLSSTFGLIFNVLIIRAFLTDKHQKTGFNLICVFRAVNNVFILIAMPIVYIPAMILGFSIYPPLVESVILVSSINLMIFNEFQGIYLSVNRLVAIYLPLYYHVLFGIKLTFGLHILYYLDRIRNVVMEHMERYESQSYLLFNTEHLAYGGINQPPDAMVIWAISLLIFPFIVNAFTFGKFFYMKYQESRDVERWQQAKKNMVQFMQTVLQDSLFSISIIFTLKLNLLIHHRFWTFFSQTFMWQIIHVLDGLIMLIFNDRLRKRQNPSRVTPVDTKQRELSQCSMTPVEH